MSAWIYDETTNLEDYVGFVYEITNLATGRKYIGQKKLWSHKFSVKTNPKTKVKKRTRIVIPSDWPKYWGSSEELKSDVLLLGEDNFSREVLMFCKTKGLMNYYEMKEQMIRDVLLREDYYNSFVGGRIHRKHVFGK